MIVKKITILLHTESKILVRKFCTLKNKYDLMLCQSRLHTVSKTLVRHKEILGQDQFSAFLHP